jgi:hypothetical protein
VVDLLQNIGLIANGATLILMQIRAEKLHQSIRNMDWLKEMHYGLPMKQHGKNDPDA